jgi:hypothetical protein
MVDGHAGIRRTDDYQVSETRAPDIRENRGDDLRTDAARVA